MDGCGRQQCPVSNPELRPRDLTAQDRELVPQHKQLDVFHVQAAPAPNEGAQQSPNGEVEEGKSHAADPPNHLALAQRHRYWRPSGIVGVEAVAGWGGFVDGGAVVARQANVAPGLAPVDRGPIEWPGRLVVVFWPFDA
jgi:hypothetical protein